MSANVRKIIFVILVCILVRPEETIAKRGGGSRGQDSGGSTGGGNSGTNWGSGSSNWGSGSSNWGSGSSNWGRSWSTWSSWSSWSGSSYHNHNNYYGGGSSTPVPTWVIVVIVAVVIIVIMLIYGLQYCRNNGAGCCEQHDWSHDDIEASRPFIASPTTTTVLTKTGDSNVWPTAYPPHPLPPSQRGDTGFRTSSDAKGPALAPSAPPLAAESSTTKPATLSWKDRPTTPSAPPPPYA